MLGSWPDSRGEEGKKEEMAVVGREAALLLFSFKLPTIQLSTSSIIGLSTLVCLFYAWIHCFVLGHHAVSILFLHLHHWQRSFGNRQGRRWIDSHSPIDVILGEDPTIRFRLERVRVRVHVHVHIQLWSLPENKP